MNNITKILLAAVGQASAADQNELLNFIDAKSPEFEAAQDEAAIEAILNAAVSAKSIKQEGKDILFTAVKKFLAIDTQSNQPGSQTDAKDPTKTGTLTDDLPKTPEASWTSGSGATKIMTAGTYTVNTTGGLLWLLALYLGATWLAVGSLSSIQFRDDIEHKYNTSLNEIVKLKDLQADVEQYSLTMMVSVSDWEHELWGLAVKFGENFDTISSPEGFKKVCPGDTSSPEGKKSCDRLREVLTEYLSYEENMKKKELALKMAVEAYATNHATNNKAEADTTKSGNMPNDLQARIGFMLKFHYGDLLKMPVQVLTLLLAIAMGVLGSTITMTWTFLDGKTILPLRWYLLRPFVGALSALVIFIFAKAGQMSLITDAANTTLSPFLLSLLGIAAGLLSDRAYAQMSSVSGKFLGNMSAEQERWSSYLKEELEKQQMDSVKLATELNLDEPRIAAIINGTQTASLQEQQRISDRLGIAPRLLFTDIAP